MGELIMPQLRIRLNDVSINPLAQVQSTSPDQRATDRAIIIGCLVNLYAVNTIVATCECTHSDCGCEWESRNFGD
jgi:hypothetical protein